MDFLKWYRRNSAAAFFVLTFAITWGSILAFTGSLRFQGQNVPFERILMAFGAMLAGPPFAAMVLTALGDGVIGLKVFAMYLTRWKAGLQWVLLSVLAGPLAVLAVQLSLTALVAPAFAPGFAITGIAVGLLTGFFEEIGWTGFALPQLRARFSPLAAALLIGFLSGLWHLLADFSGSTPGQEGYWAASFVLFWLAPLTAYRVLMVWVYNNTRSMLLMQLMNATLTGALFVFRPELDPELALVFHASLTILLWLVVMLLVAVTGPQLSRRAARSTAATSS